MDGYLKVEEGHVVEDVNAMELAGVDLILCGFEEVMVEFGWKVMGEGQF